MPKWSDHDIDNTGDCLPDCWCKNPSPSSSDLVEDMRAWRGTWNPSSGPHKRLTRYIEAVQKLEAEKATLQAECLAYGNAAIQADEAADTIQRLEAERAEAYEKGRESAFEEIGNYYLMRKDCQDALAKAQATITALQSELEISHARYLNYDELATAEIKSLQSERDRLRGVLTEISNSAFGDDATNELSMEGCISLARRALAGKD
jgi:DNA repair exonuclease SbcCD ATPase subunit